TTSSRGGQNRRSWFGSGSSPSRWRCWRSRHSSFGEHTMTQHDLAEGLVRGSALLEQLEGRRVTVVGDRRQDSATARLVQKAGAWMRVESVGTDADLTRDTLVVVNVAAALTDPAVIAARAAGVPVLGDLDFEWLARGGDAFAIIGGINNGVA